ncbi:MAG: hypothetical protein M3071_15175 [Actinomycetota bacterium]|nr:hypothetical protein [Actinomycetota bacterium]
MSKDDRSLIADWLVLFSALVLCVSLFLTWSSLSPAYVTLADKLQALQGIPRDPTAWQVYSAADVLLALLVLALLGVALKGPRRARICILVACIFALAFVIHAEGAPPTTAGATVLRPTAGGAFFVPPAPTPGAGETAAIIALVGAIGGLTLSLTAE